MVLMSNTQLTDVQKKINKKARHILRASKIWMMEFSQPQQPYRYIFHHIPKCAGTSAFDALTHWFICIKDYPPPWAWGNEDDPQAYEKFCNRPKNLANLCHYHILSGHYHLPGSFIHERYPSFLEQESYRLITFLRHPLQVQISLHYYEIRMKRISPQEPLEKHLLTRNNYLATVIPCNESNYKDVLNRYFFIGLVENYQESFEKLAALLKKPRIQVDNLNQSPRSRQRLSPGFLSEFEESNRLDYQIYNYAKTLYQQNAWL